MQASKSFRLHIGIFGRRNVGKSSVLNALTNQEVSIVSEIAGTTTDPVEKPMELLPLGPVLFIDTAGIDDTSTLGEKRVQKTMSVFDRTELGLIISKSDEWGDFEEGILKELNDRAIPSIIVFNKSDLLPAGECLAKSFSGEKIQFVETSALTGFGMLDLRQAILDHAPDDFINRSSLVSDLVGQGEMAVLVIPIDKEAPKGRIILPQVQCIRDLLDHDSFCMVVKDRELSEALNRLNKLPKLVVTDSQAFRKVNADTPPEIPITSFSILFARLQGDLSEMVRGALTIDQLKPGDKVLIAEACSHHPIEDDIGKVKIPNWLNQFIGGKLDFSYHRGHDFPANLSEFKLIIHCGACMWNRREMLSRMMKARMADVPITNYGLTIAYSLGIFERALQPFPEALEVFQQKKKDPIQF
jgi:[FeFe] hydrogenase H-cluster maturation GTPase HydF